MGRSDGGGVKGESLLNGSLSSVLERLYGSVDWRAADGVLQVTAIGEEDRATIALGPAAPPSGVDRFVLGFARARVEALITTGSILRAEPDLRHCYAEDSIQDAAWAKWRVDTLGLSGNPALLVMSRSGDFPKDHPAIEAATSGLVWTSRETRDRLGDRLGALDVVASEDGLRNCAGHAAKRSGIEGLICYARARLGLHRLSVETGPAASGPLYDTSAAAEEGVEEILLSLFGGELAPEARAASFASPAQLVHLGLLRQSACGAEEPSGPWTFERYRKVAS